METEEQPPGLAFGEASPNLGSHSETGRTKRELRLLNLKQTN